MGVVWWFAIPEPWQRRNKWKQICSQLIRTTCRSNIHSQNEWGNSRWGDKLKGYVFIHTLCHSLGMQVGVKRKSICKLIITWASIYQHQIRHVVITDMGWWWTHQCLAVHVGVPRSRLQIWGDGEVISATWSTWKFHAVGWVRLLESIKNPLREQ